MGRKSLVTNWNIRPRAFRVESWRRVWLTIAAVVLLAVFAAAVWYLLAVVLPTRERAETLIRLKQLELQYYGRALPDH